MKKIIIFGGLAVAAIAVILVIARPSGMKKVSDGTATTSTTAPNSVTIKNYTFSPNPLKVKKGTSVTWTNTDIARHNIVADGGKTGGPDGPLFGKGETYSFTFNTVGKYAYHCEPHPYMHGEVEVTE